LELFYPAISLHKSVKKRQFDYLHFLTSPMDDFRAHGKDERIGVKEFNEGVELMCRFIKAITSEKL
jgi:hypothetical protein